jgi:SPP1 gp7 family putative phage head morphogenesis protein
LAKQLNLNTAERIRVQLTVQQQRDIENMYKRIARDINREAKRLPKDTTSGALRGMYLSGLKRQVNEQLQGLGQQLESSITSNMTEVAGAVAEDNLQFLRAVGMPLGGEFSHVPKDVVESIITGKVYQGNWSLSKSIWKHTQKAQKDIHTIIAEGVAKNKSAYDIAKDLEKYVNPSAKKEWDWGKVYPGTAKKVDYNAQRLARTMVSHAYQQSFVRTTQSNPFVTMYQWESSNSGHTCALCDERDGCYFSKDDLPMDHPNGMCTYIAVMEDSMVDIADRIADWATGSSDPELDAYYEFLQNS